MTAGVELGGGLAAPGIIVWAVAGLGGGPGFVVLPLGLIGLDLVVHGDGDGVGVLEAAFW